MNAAGTQMQDLETPEPVTVTVRSSLPSRITSVFCGQATETVMAPGYPSSDPPAFSHQDPFSSSPYAQNEAVGVAPVTVTSSAEPAEPGSKSLADLDDNPFNKTSL